MLGLVLGPGEVLGVGLVVLGVSVPMPPADEPEDEPPLVPEESDGMLEVPELEPVLDPVLDPELDPPDVSGRRVSTLDGLELDSAAGVVLPEVPLDEVPLELVPLSEGIPDVPPLELVPEPLVPELPPMPESEPPPVMPAHAPSSIAQAIGNIHFVIDHSRKFQKGTRHGARRWTALLMQRVEAGGE